MLGNDEILEQIIIHIPNTMFIFMNTIENVQCSMKLSKLSGESLCIQ